MYLKLFLMLAASGMTLVLLLGAAVLASEEVDAAAGEQQEVTRGKKA